MDSSSASSTAAPLGLNDSWVELNASSGGSSPTPSLVKMLGDAQKETASNSSKGSLDSPPLSSPDRLSSTPPLSSHNGSSGNDTHQPVHPEQLTKKIRDWSSRPEIIPPSDYGLKYDYEQPAKGKKHPLSVRNTRVMKDDWFSNFNMKMFWFSNTISIIIGLWGGWNLHKKFLSIYG